MRLDVAICVWFLWVVGASHPGNGEGMCKRELDNSIDPLRGRPGYVGKSSFLGLREGAYEMHIWKVLECSCRISTCAKTRFRRYRPTIPRDMYTNLDTSQNKRCMVHGAWCTLHGTGVAVLHFHVARWPLLTCDCFVRCSYLQACPCDCGCSCWEGDGTFTSYTHRTWAMRNAIALHQCIGLSLHPSVSMTLLCCSCCATVHRGLRAHPLPQVCSNMLQLPSDVWGCIVVFLQSDALSQVCRRLWTCK